MARATIKYNTFVAVFFPHEDNAARYVTRTEGHSAYWEAGKPAFRFNETFARDLALGLCLNGSIAAVVKFPDGIEPENPAVETESA